MKPIIYAGVVMLAAPWLAAQTPAYVCPDANGAAVYASEPFSVECQPAQALGASQDQAAQQLWQGGTLPAMDDVRVLPRQSTPPLQIRLRRTAPAPKAAPAPARVAPPPKPLTPKQLIQRDIAAEQRALNREKQQLQQAQQQGNTARARTLQQTVADREANIRALQQELARQ